VTQEPETLAQTPVLNTDFRRPMTIGLLVFVLLFGVTLAWAVLAPMSSAVVAPGTVIVRGRPQLVQHLDGGIIRNIYVRNGDAVKAGDVVVRLDDVLLLANLEIYRNRLRTAAARKARLEAERDSAPAIHFDDALVRTADLGDDSSQRTQQQEIFEARRISLDGQIAQLNEKISQLNNQISGAEGLIDARQQQLDLVEKELEGLRFLQKKAIAPITRVLAVERERADLLGQLAEYKAERARVENTISETKITILQVRRQFQESVLNELLEVSNQVDDLLQQMLATSKQLERIDIRAPISGIVHELLVNTIGGVIPPGGTIMQLISTEEGVEIEANIETHAIDDVFIGQEAVIRFSAFNQRTTPEIHGTVARISPSSVIDEKTGISFYRVVVDAPAEEMDKLGDLKLIPGMPAEVFIQTGERSPLSYLLKPLIDQFNRAMTEK
jgi:HlyD family secretion protein